MQYRSGVLNIILPLSLALLFSLIYSLFSVNRHLNFESNAYDLGINVQISYLFSQGQLIPYSTLKHMIIYGDHFSLIFLFLSPIYKLFPSPNTLLILQAIFVASSSIPLYYLALVKLKSSFLSFVLILVYLTSSGILSAISFDIHLATMSILPLSLALFGLFFKKFYLYWLAVVLSLLCKEDMAIIIAGLGIYEIFLKQKGLGITTLILSVSYYYFVKFHLMPYFWSDAENSYISRSVLPLKQPLDLVLLMFSRPSVFWQVIINSPIKTNTLYRLLGEYLFLPALSPLYWLTVFPHLYLRFTGVLDYYWDIAYHYNSSLEPFLFTSAILVISRYKISYLLLAILLIISVLLSGLSPSSLISNTLFFPYQQNPQLNYIHQSLTQVPAAASVSAQSPLFPHLANRQKIYLFPDIGDAQYIVLDTKLSHFSVTNQDYQKRFSQLKRSKSWSIIYQNQSFYIFKRTPRLTMMR